MKENKITLLGTGCAIPNKLRNPPGILITYEDKINILLDIGSGISRIICNHISILDISHILLSHFHIDHISDLFYFLKANYMLRRADKLTIMGGKGLNNLYNKWLDAHNYMKNNLDFVIIEEITPEMIITLPNNIEIIGVKVPHGDSSLAYLIKKDDFKIVYSGDTGYSDDLISLARNANVLIHECSLTDDIETELHVTPSLLSEIAKKASVKKLIATHFYPICDSHLPEIETILKKNFKGDVILGKDGEIIYF